VFRAVSAELLDESGDGTNNKAESNNTHQYKSKADEVENRLAMLYGAQGRFRHFTDGLLPSRGVVCKRHEPTR